MSLRFHTLVSVFLLVLAARARALQILLDYSFDAANGNYFGSHGTAAASLEKAAHDLGAAITTSPSAVTAKTFSAAVGNSTMQLDWTLAYPNPFNGQTVNPANLNIAADTVMIHVGFRTLPNSLGASSMATAAALPSFPRPGTFPDRQSATTAAANLSNNMIPRGASPTMGSTSASAGSAHYDVSYGPFGGSVWFNAPNGTADTVALDSFWQFDATQPVPADKYDFYSVALREMTHALGFGQSDSWRANIDLNNATTWDGAKVRALFGGDGSNLITTDGQIAGGLGGSSLVDGRYQIAALTPDLPKGTRRFLTSLDTAFLQDSSYNVIPEPQSALLLATGGAALAAARPRRRFRDDR